jgi:hypothetical protein
MFKRKLIELITAQGYVISKNAKDDEVMEAISHHLDYQYLMKANSISCNSSSAQQTEAEQKMFLDGLATMIQLSKQLKKI